MQIEQKSGQPQPVNLPSMYVFTCDVLSPRLKCDAVTLMKKFKEKEISGLKCRNVWIRLLIIF